MRKTKPNPLVACVLATLLLPSYALALDEDDRIHAETPQDDNASKKSEAKVKISGFVRSVVEAEKFQDGESFHEARVEFETKRRKGMRAELELDFRTKTDDIQVNEALLDKKWDDGLRMKVGYDLKRFGLEYEESRLERPTIDRSYIYRSLEIFNYAGRESVVRLEKSTDGSNRDWSMTASLSEAQNFTLLGNWQTDVGRSRYGGWLQLGTHKGQDGTKPVAALINSIWQRNSEGLYQIELVNGIDPDQTEYEAVFADEETVLFSGLNGLWGRVMYRDGDESILGLAGASVVFHDHRKNDYNSLVAMLGVRYELGELRISANAELVARNSPVDLGKRTYDESVARLEALYAF